MELISLILLNPEENIAIPINGLKSNWVSYSLNEPLTHSFVLKAFHSILLLEPRKFSCGRRTLYCGSMHHLSQIFKENI